MAEADAEDWNAAEEFLNVLNGVADRLWVAGSIRKKNPVRLKVENVRGRSLRRDDPHVAVVIHKKPQNILLDAKIIGRYAKLASVRNSAGLAHRFRPGRNREFDRAFFPPISLFAGHAASEFLTSHRWQLLGFENQLLGRSTVCGHNTAKRPNITNMANERARVDIPDGWDLVPIQIQLSGFRRAPVRGHLRELTHNERFNVRARRLLVVKIGADVSNMRIGQANDLPGVAGVCKNFLITGEAGIENDLSAAARDRARGTAVKYAPVFQSESGGSVLNFGQVVLRVWS